MGAISFSIDPRLIESLRQIMPLDVFVETGTFHGDTIEIVKPYFNHIYSIELSEHYHTKACEKFADDERITLIYGDSAIVLSAIIPQLDERPVLYWLDAHWCVANATAGESSQCGLLSEISAIKTLNNESIIIIDDARLFLSTPQKPHEISNWPTFHEILGELFKLSSSHHIAVVNDCILFFPETIKEHIKQFSHEQGIDWLDMLNRCNKSQELLIKISEELELLHNISVKKRIKGIFGHIWRKTKNQLNRINNDI